MKTTYHSVAEIFEAMDETRARLDATLAGLGPEQEAARDAPDRWSVAEIVEHLAKVERQIGKLAGMMLAQIESDGAAASVDGDEADAFPIALEEMGGRSLGEKFQAPETALPRGGKSVADSHARLQEARAALDARRPLIASVNASGARFPHPVFGPLNLYQWLAVLGLHEERHRRQIETLLGTASGER